MGLNSKMIESENSKSRRCYSNIFLKSLDGRNSLIPQSEIDQPIGFKLPNSNLAPTRFLPLILEPSSQPLSPFPNESSLEGLEEVSSIEKLGLSLLKSVNNENQNLQFQGRLTRILENRRAFLLEAY